MPKQITLEEILKKYNELIDSLPSRVSETPRQVVADFITTYFTEFAESLRLERIASIIPNPDYTQGKFDGYNEAKATIDKRVDAALNKPSI